LNRIWTLVQDFLASEDGEVSEETTKAIQLTTHQMIKKITEDINENRYNTAIAAAMGTVNDLYKLKTDSLCKGNVWQEALGAVVACVAPFAPHIADELWQQLGHKDSVQKDSWPAFNDDYLATDQMTIAVQVNGKLRSEIKIASDASKDDILAAALADNKVAAHLDGAEPKKSIYVPNKLVNFVA
jgi:leucyl-tRNA synthetase